MTFPISKALTRLPEGRRPFSPSSGSESSSSRPPPSLSLRQAARRSLASCWHGTSSGRCVHPARPSGARSHVVLAVPSLALFGTISAPKQPARRPAASIIYRATAICSSLRVQMAPSVGPWLLAVACMRLCGALAVEPGPGAAEVRSRYYVNRAPKRFHSSAAHIGSHGCW